MRGKNWVLKRGKSKSFSMGIFFLVAFTFLLLPFGQAFGLFIDNFEGTQDYTLTAPGIGANTYAGPNILGGQRRVELTYISGSAALNAKTFSAGSFNVMSFSEASSVNGTGNIVWNNGPFDLTDGGLQTALRFRYIVNDHNLDVTFRVHDSGGFADYVFHLVGGVAQQNITVPYSTFAGIDMTAVTKIEIKIPEGIPGIGNENDLAFGPIDTEGIQLTCNKTFNTDSVNPGDVITATVTISVISGTGSVNVDVKDILDSGLVYEATGTVDAPDTVSADGRTMTWTSRTVSSGAPLTLMYNISVASISGGQSLCNSVQAFSETGSPVTGICKACVTYTPVVPTFSQWGIVGFLLLLAVSAVWLMRRRRSIS